MMKIKPTQEQQDVIDYAATGMTMKVAALAGTGKTSTLVMIANAYPKRRGLYLAYNRSLKEEAEKKFPSWIDCKTVHGLAYPKTGFMFNDQLSSRILYADAIKILGIATFRDTIDMGKLETLTIELSPYLLLSKCRLIVKNFQNYANEEILLKDISWLTRHEIRKKHPEIIITSQDCHLKADNVKKFFEDLDTTLLSYSQKLWDLQKSAHSKVIPAEHDTYLKLYQLNKPILDQYDYIMCDESQDANGCQIDILSRQKCQVIYVGDQYQQIYAYRGTINAMANIQGQTFYLTQSFRFGDQIANEANKVLKELQSPVSLRGASHIESTIGTINSPPYTYLARTNVTLIDLYVKLIEKGWKCSIQIDIEDVIKLLTAMFYLWKNEKFLVKDDRVSCFNEWKDLKNFAEFEEDQELSRGIAFISFYRDKTPSIIEIMKTSSKIQEHEADIILSTAHKAKGREWDNVALADDFNPNKNEMEKNIYYVAVTRAKLILDLPE